MLIRLIWQLPLYMLITLHHLLGADMLQAQVLLSLHLAQTGLIILERLIGLN